MAELTISERQAGEIVILDLTGDIIYNEGTLTLRRAVRRLIGEGRVRIALNLAGLCYVDSGGIGEFISTLTAVRRERNGQLILLDPPERVAQLLEISNLTRIFDIRPGEAAAV